MITNESRRKFLAVAALSGTSVFFVASKADGEADAGVAMPAAPKPADVNATEDLMREHGVLRRVLLVYGESIARLGRGEMPAQVVNSAARIIKRFIEGYHEKTEEQFVFPKMQQVGKLTELVAVLAAQHLAGRKVTDEILLRSQASKRSTTEQRQALAEQLQRFIRMYQPHAAREDTELFPAYHDLFTEQEFDALGDQFEEQEHKLLGSGGFEGAVKEVAQLESALGINDLAQFTPL